MEIAGRLHSYKDDWRCVCVCVCVLEKLGVCLNLCCDILRAHTRYVCVCVCVLSQRDNGSTGFEVKG